MHDRLRYALYGIPLLLAALASACGGGDSDAEGTVFVFRLRGDDSSQDFRIRSSSAAFVDTARAELTLPESSRRLAPAGSVRRGDGSHNAPWSWHLTSETLSQVHAEACDGRSSEVEADLDYWVDRLGRFCPWTAYVLREEP